MSCVFLTEEVKKRTLPVEDVARLRRGYSAEIKQIPTRTSSSGIDVSRTSAAEKSNSSIERERKRDWPPEGGRGGVGREKKVEEHGAKAFRGRRGEKEGGRKREREAKGEGIKKGKRGKSVEHGAAERGQGDNCRRAPSRCSCKEVLRRDKAPAITIEPRGNSCLRVTRTRAWNTLDAHTRCRI